MGLAVCEDVSWFVLVCGGEYVAIIFAQRIFYRHGSLSTISGGQRLLVGL